MAGREIDWRVFHHFCLTYDGPSRGGESTLAFYFDGDHQWQETLSLNTKINDGTGMSLGMSQMMSYPLSAALDEVYVYASALDASAVAVLYGSVSTAPTVTPVPTSHLLEDSLVAYYPFVDGTTQDAHHTWHGTPESMTTTEGRDGSTAIVLEDGAAVTLPWEVVRDIDGDADRTVCLWARIDEWNGGYLFHYGGSSDPTAAPSYLTWVPTTAPPSYAPSKSPIPAPSTWPTPQPSYIPTLAPIPSPTKTEAPSYETWIPTAGPPTYKPSSVSTRWPTWSRTRWPTWSRPTYQPTKSEAPTYETWVPNKKAGLSATFEEERKQEEDLQDADAAYMATFQPEVNEPPTPKRTALQMLIDRVDTRARKIRVELAEEAARRDPTIDDVIEVTPSKREVSSEEDEPVYTPGRGAEARANRRRLRLEAEARKRALEEELARLPPGTDPWVKIAPLGLGNLRLNLAPAAQAAEAWPRPDAYSASRGDKRPRVWKCPCGAKVRFALRGDHLRYDCASFRESLEGAAGKWLAAHDPAEADDVVVECAAVGEVSPGAALCALAVSRRDGPDAAHKKLEQLDYRDEMELAAEVTGADDLLERWRSGRPLRRRVKRSRTTRRLLSPTGDDVQKPRAELPSVRGGRAQPL